MVFLFFTFTLFLISSSRLCLFVCMSALMMGVLPFTHFTFTFSKHFSPGGVCVHVCPNDGGVIIQPFHFHFFLIQFSPGGVSLNVCPYESMMGVLAFNNFTFTFS